MVRAAAQQLTLGPLDAIDYHGLAVAAGVSEREVRELYPAPGELEAALSQLFRRELFPTSPRDLQEIVSSLPEQFAAFSHNAELVDAMIGINGGRIRGGLTREALWPEVARAVANTAASAKLDEIERRRIAGLAFLLRSPALWHALDLRQRTPRPAAVATWALETLYAAVTAVDQPISEQRWAAETLESPSNGPAKTLDIAPREQPDLTGAAPLILRATADLLRRREWNAISYREIADEAGVSERTVYRRFATRDALAQALHEELSARVEPEVVPATIWDFVQSMPARFSRMDENGHMARALLKGAGRAAWNERVEKRDERIDEMRALLVQAGVTKQRERILALVYTLRSATSWRILCGPCGLSGIEAGRAAGWLIGLLVRSAQVDPTSLEDIDGAVKAQETVRAFHARATQLTREFETALKQCRQGLMESAVTDPRLEPIGGDLLARLDQLESRLREAREIVDEPFETVWRDRAERRAGRVSG